MNGNFRQEQFNYDYRIPHWGFHYVNGMYLSHQMPVHHAHDMRLPYYTPAHYYGMRHSIHQMPAHYYGLRHSTHQMPAHYPYMRPLPQQMRAHYADKRHLPQQKPKHCADKRPLPHQTPKDFADKKTSPPKKPEDFVDKKTSPHKKPEDLADKKNLPHQKPEDFTDNKCLPQQTSDLPQQTSNLPQQTPEDHADKNSLPHQTSEPTIPAVAPVQCPKQTIVSCEICDVSFPQKTLEGHNNGKKHQRNLSKLCEQSTKRKTSKEQHEIQHCALEKNDQPNSNSMDLHALAGSNNNALTEDASSDSDAIAIAPTQGPMPSQIVSQTKVEEGKGHYEVQNCGEKDCANKKCLPHQIPKPTIPSDKKCLPHCEICKVMIPSSNIKKHNNGKRHRANVKSMECKISKGEKSGHIRNSQMNSVEKVPKSKKDGRPVENICEASRFRSKEVPAEGSKRKLGNHTGAKDHGFKIKNEKNEDASIKIKKVPAERSKRKVRDNTDVKDHGLKHEIGEASGGKYMKTNNGIRRPMKSSKPEDNALSNLVKMPVRIPELTPSGHTTSPKMAPIPVEGSSFQLQSQHVSASLSQESKDKEHHKFQNIVENNDQPQSTPVELNASEGSNRIEDFAAIAPPQFPVTCPVFAPPAAVGSYFEPKNHIDSQREVTEAKEHCEFQNHVNAGSGINTLIKGTCSDSGAIVIAPPQSPIASLVSTPVAPVESSFEPESQQVIQTEMSEGKVHNDIQSHDIQSHTVDSNDQQQSISMELHDPAGCMTNTQTEADYSDSTAIEIVIEPLASAPPDVVGSDFEPLTQHSLHTDIEPQVSEAVVYHESHHPIEETDIELPPSVSMEIDDASEVNTETETADGSPQAEMEMDDLADELEIIELPQVSVCLTCGDEGFTEAIVYCNKCEDYVIHRYCLEGAVIFTDKVIWFCEDCEQEVVDADYLDSETADSENSEGYSSEDCVIAVDPQPVADPIWRGSLQVSYKSDDKIIRLMGHLSTLACLKVLEETRHLPNVLYGNLLQRSAVWPESFTKFGTNNLSIALYFFPQNERFERYYDQLVHEIISNDLAIRVTVEKSELLIFPSTMLPSQYKRFQSKYYLWGFFRKNQAPFKINVTGSGRNGSFLPVNNLLNSFYANNKSFE